MPRLIACVLLAACLAPVACRRPPPTLAATTITVTDGLGREVALPGPPARVVSLSPAMTEMLFAIGAGGRVVGVTTACDFPPEAAQLEKVSGFTREPDPERILARRPDLVAVAGDFPRASIDAIAAAGVPVFVAQPKTVADVLMTLEKLGELTGQKVEAATLVASLRERLDAAAARAKARLGPKPRVLFLVSDTPLMAAGPATLIGQLIELAGGENVLTDRGNSYPTLNDEALLANPPDVILVGESMLAAIQMGVAARPGWHTVPAVRLGRVRGVPEGQTFRPGPRLAEGLEAVEGALH